MADQHPQEFDSREDLEQAIGHAMWHLNEALMAGKYPEVRRWTDECARLRALR
jgi:hypothetical protein